MRASEKGKYIVCTNLEFYPWIEEFQTLEEAKKEYARLDTYTQDVFLCEIIEVKRDTDTNHDEET